MKNRETYEKIVDDVIQHVKNGLSKDVATRLTAKNEKLVYNIGKVICDKVIGHTATKHNYESEIIKETSIAVIEAVREELFE